ncbi:putative trehalose synthase [Tuber indicum]|nr:putative trehalose synthase [Tuber indicum]
MDCSEAPHTVKYPVDTAPTPEGTIEQIVWGEISVMPLYLGLAASMIGDTTVRIGFSIRNHNCSLDYCANKLIFSDGNNMRNQIMENIIDTIIGISTSNRAKFVGAGVTLGLDQICPGISSDIWKKLDIVCVLSRVPTRRWGTFGDTIIRVSEQADSAALECVRCFGQDHNPILRIGSRNQVMPDAEGAIKLVRCLGDYESTVHKDTWNMVQKYSYELGGYNDDQTKGDPQHPPVKVAFFSSTPQGGGVALMRHALVRFCSELGVDMSWFIPIPSTALAFRITKNNHNILQGVANPGVRLTPEKQDVLNQWTRRNAEKYWLTPGGPLAPGGADVVIIDDPQMPALIPLIKKARPEVKIIYRSHIEVRKDLVEQVGSPQEQVWKWIWDFVKEVDVFISHPVSTFVPSDVPFEKIGFMPACTDWLDGLNKPLGERDLKFYHCNLRNLCNEQKVNHLLYPAREYITQIASFDPSKGIPYLIESYHELCDRIIRHAPEMLPPQLLICGHGAIDDPDADLVCMKTKEFLQNSRYAAIAKDVVVVRIGPSDQMLNAMITNAKIVLQLSVREGFEVKVSEALYHGKPVVATRAGGIPLQIENGKSGFLVDVDDSRAVANHLFDLYTDKDLYTKMSSYAKASLSDEVGTVGNAACWFYLVAKLARGPGIQPHASWVMDLAKEEAGQEYEPGQPILSRKAADLKGKGKA